MKNTSIVLKEWVELYTFEMLSWAVYKTSDQQTAEDLAQETFLAAFQAYHTFKNKSKPKTWLFEILKNKIIDHYRKSFKTSTSTIEQTEEEHGTHLYNFSFTRMSIGKRTNILKNGQVQAWNYLTILNSITY